jgi:sugar transferase (PEP-CTERM/EpsH1 system associated)
VKDERPLIAHIVFRFDYGGLENGIVNLVNGSADARFRHAIIALTEATEFSARLRVPAPVFALGKRPGKDPAAYWRLFKLLRTLRPAAVHTRNIGTLDCTLIAFLARVPVRIHGEHGWDVFDPDGTNRKYRWMRRILAPFVQTFVAVSEDLRRWLVGVVGIPAGKVTHICNGVDVERFRPATGDARHVLPPEILAGGGVVVVGSVTRFSAIKDPLNLVEAFIRTRAALGSLGDSVRLVMIGDGELRSAALARLEQAGLAAAAWLPGSRTDVPALMQSMDIFVLGSLREGVSNTVLEAMACGLPVIASATGGNVELVAAGETGALVPPGDPGALAEAIAQYVSDPARRRLCGARARERAVAQFSIGTMLASYRALYDRTLTTAEA